MTHRVTQVRMCSEDYWLTNGELCSDIALLTLLCNLVPSTTPLTSTVSAGGTCQVLRSTGKGNVAMIQRCACSSYRHTWVTFSCPALVLTARISAQTVQISPGPWASAWLLMFTASLLPCCLYLSQEISGELRMERQATVHPLDCMAA